MLEFGVSGNPYGRPFPSFCARDLESKRDIIDMVAWTGTQWVVKDVELVDGRVEVFSRTPIDADKRFRFPYGRDVRPDDSD